MASAHTSRGGHDASEEEMERYYDSLPRKRLGAGVVFRDADGRLLLVRPAYKPTWELPGGVVEAGESPAACAAREVREELGVELPVGRLLVVDWLPVRPPKTEGVMIQFDGGVVDEAVTSRFRLPPDELSGWRWFADAELDDVLSENVARRMRVALDAVRSGTTAYLEHGHSPTWTRTPGGSRPSLLLLKGPPGSGKSTIARELGRRLRWPVIDKDVIRDLLPDELGGISYQAMLDLAERQMGMGLSVIADSPLGYGIGYRRALEIAKRTGSTVLVVECECSDRATWQRRIELRADLGLASHHTTDWDRVDAFHRRAAADPYEVDVPSIRVDTVAPLEDSLKTVIGWLRERSSTAAVP